MLILLVETKVSTKGQNLSIIMDGFFGNDQGLKNSVR